MFQSVVLLAVLSSACAFTSLTMVQEGFSKSLPFLKKPKNLDGLVVTKNYKLYKRDSISFYYKYFQGNYEFDPLGFAETFDPKFLQEAELKHGRVSMLATVGWLVQSAGIHLPSPDGLYDVKNPIDAFFHVGASPIAQVSLYL